MVSRSIHLFTDPVATAPCSQEAAAPLQSSSATSEVVSGISLIDLDSSVPPSGNNSHIYAYRNSPCCAIPPWTSPAFDYASPQMAFPVTSMQSGMTYAQPYQIPMHAMPGMATPGYPRMQQCPMQMNTPLARFPSVPQNWRAQPGFPAGSAMQPVFYGIPPRGLSPGAIQSNAFTNGGNPRAVNPTISDSSYVSCSFLDQTIVSI